ncbi:MAG: endolytic transglycosylase MltG [Lachnospiraceae bacterium]|nr:endolytic transglycosylase MltG [Lachnospiraceae bacterium]
MNTRKAAMRVGSICLKVAIFILICLGIVYLGQMTYHYTHAVFSDEAFEEEPGRVVKLNIPEDISSKKLSEVLEENGVIEDAGIFRIQMKMADFGDTVKAGAYELNTSMTPTEIFKILSETNEDE